VTATGDARDYFQYFGAVAGDPSKGYYSFDLGSWHIIALNTNCSKVGGCAAGSAQETWLRADLQTHPTSCTMAFMHYPRYSTVAPYSSLTALWQALYDNNAEIVLAAHDHHYERFGPRDANGNADQARGIVEFIVGTGGKQPNQSFGGMDTPLATGTAPGVVKLTLNSSSYDWQFVPTTGYSYNDFGSRSCHGSTASGSNGPIIGFTGNDSASGPGSNGPQVAAESEIAQRMQDAIAAHVTWLSIATVLALITLVSGAAISSDPRMILRRIRPLDRRRVTPMFERIGG
jgi:hypothetical protein